MSAASLNDELTRPDALNLNTELLQHTDRSQTIFTHQVIAQTAGSIGQG